jgi:hypothetical protein
MRVFDDEAQLNRLLDGLAARRPAGRGEDITAIAVGVGHSETVTRPPQRCV